METPRPKDLKGLDLQIWRYGEDRTRVNWRNKRWLVFGRHLQALPPPNGPRLKPSEEAYQFTGQILMVRGMTDETKVDLLKHLHEQAGQPNELRVFGKDFKPIHYGKQKPADIHEIDL